MYFLRLVVITLIVFLMFLIVIKLITYSDYCASIYITIQMLIVFDLRKKDDRRIFLLSLGAFIFLYVINYKSRVLNCSQLWIDIKIWINEFLFTGKVFESPPLILKVSGVIMLVFILNWLYQNLRKPK